MGSGNWIDREELWERRQDRKWESFSWLTVRALLSSVNDVIGKGAPRLVNELRDAWVVHQRDADSNGRWDDDHVVPVPGAKSFLLLGDPGEQDGSQYAVVPVLASQDDVDFMVVMSDVIYPSGDVNDYIDGFYIPYRALAMPIYALPGNHDWYDGLNGFMWNFCGAEPLPPTVYDAASYTLRERIARRIWKKASAPRRDTLNAYRNERATGAAWEPLQPGPYYALDTGELLVVCVDSGITGDIDRNQAEWLVRVSESTTKSKLLLVGRPLIDKMQHRPGPFPRVAGVPVKASDGTELASVDDVARHKPYRYVAAIGGDTHNFQRYDVTLDHDGKDERPFHYVVSGGGGAYMSATHIIDAAGELGFDDDQAAAKAAIRLDRFECYPSRPESLRYFAALMVPRLWRLVVALALGVLGFAVAALAVLVADIDARTLEGVLAVAAAALGLLFLVVFFRPGRRTRPTQPSRRRQALTYGASFVAGLVGGLAAWWLSPAEFGEHVVVIAAAVAAVGIVSQLLRKTDLWRRTAIGVLFIVGQVLVGFAALRIFVLEDADTLRKAVMVAAAIVAPPLLLMLVDAVREHMPHRYKPVLLAGLALLAAAAIWLLDGSWWRAVAAAVVIVAVGLLVVALGHLHFLNAFSLFYRPDMRSGALSMSEAGKELASRTPGAVADAPEPRTRRIARMVHPGSSHPHGPLHRFVSEIFDKDDPPLYKNFLRVDVADGGLTVTCFHATGTESGPGDVTHEEPIAIRFPEP
jgi:Calcineurin-like phosphoesterase